MHIQFNSKTILSIALFFAAIMLISILSNLTKKERFPYKIRLVFLSESEKRFFTKMLEYGFAPFAKVRIGDFVSATDRKQEYIAKIASRSVEFLITDVNCNPLGVVLFTNGRRSAIYTA